ncbi:MAG TPA: GNAT family N-acetyltransferase [Microvirga sp.]|jgi:GNAT superfamily N-acetyltransferase|nr:GNAT family N-acetyltransferase [Microvirga sp.]
MSSPQGSFVVSDLREHPGFAKVVANRIWRAWWQGKGYPLHYIEGRVAESLDGTAVPFAAVAHERGEFLGTASVIPSDLEERPEYTPWVAAVWVDPEHRHRGVASALVRKAAQGAFESGADLVYLCALPEKRAFYERLGWQRREENVGEGGLTVLRLSRNP